MRSSLNDLITKNQELYDRVSSDIISKDREELEAKANAEGLKCPICGHNIVVKYVKSLKYRLRRCLARDCSYEVAHNGNVE